MKNIKLYIGLLFAVYVFAGCFQPDVPNVVSFSKEPSVLNVSKHITHEDQQQFVPLSDCNTKATIEESGFYSKDLNGISVSGKWQQNNDSYLIEFITIRFPDIDKAIFRRLEAGTTLTSAPSIFKNIEKDSYVFIFPLVGEYNFGWVAYLYTGKQFLYLGKQVAYWKPGPEENGKSYCDFSRVYQKGNNILLVMPDSVIIAYDKDYKMYPEYSKTSGRIVGHDIYYEYSIQKDSFFYRSGEYLEGDYTMLLTAKIINENE